MTLQALVNPIWRAAGCNPRTWIVTGPTEVVTGRSENVRLLDIPAKILRNWKTNVLLNPGRYFSNPTTNVSTQPKVIDRSPTIELNSAHHTSF
jgi:hypothetical protein